MNSPTSSDGPRGATRVRNAGIALFADRGFHGTGIRDLAGEAGMSSASLYHHMSSKETLLAEIMTTALRRLITAARLVTGHVTDPAEQLGRLIALHVLTHAMRPAETRVVDNEVAALTPQTRESVVRLRDDYENLFGDAIADGVRSGSFGTTEPTLARLALLEMCNGVARWYSPDGALDVATLAAHHAHIGLRMVDAAPPENEPDIALCLRIVTRLWDD